MNILVVEDDARHQRDVRAFFKSLPDATARFAWTLQEALELLKNEAFEGILTDIYMPITQAKRLTEATHPMGVAVILLAQERRIPCIVVTAGFHHGPRYNDVCVLLRALGLPEIVDGPDSVGDAESHTKDWSSGFHSLRKLIERKA